MSENIQNLAPNGKPSKLTPEQWKLVRTPEFKAWFGDWENYPKNASKIVDENGEPLIMYHGSSYDFTVFETNGIESDRDDRDFKSRFWFIVDKNWGDNYSNSRSTSTNKTYEVFLNIRNPKYDFNLYADDDNDGSVEFRDRKVWVAIATLSNQIKLADGTNTTFDSNNPDIRFEKGGLIAPNGKPSKLTPEQYKLVRTTEFKAWFGDWETDPENSSKVVDKNGEPLVVYRGMPKKRKLGNVFKYNVNLFGKRGVGGRETNTFAFYFTDEKSVAEKYALNFADNEEIVVKPYFLNIKNLFKAFEKPNQTKILFHQLYDLANNTGAVVLEKHADLRGEKEEWLDVYRDQRRKYDYSKDSRLSYSPMPIYSFFVDWSKNDANQDFWRVYLDDLLGYNGLSFYEDTHNYDYTDNKMTLRFEEISKTYGVFDSENIKLADGTNTTFDSNNPDIRFERGGKIIYLKGKKTKLWQILQNHYLTKEEAEIDNQNYSQLNIFKKGELSEMINVKAFDEENYYDFDMFEKQIAKILKDKLVDKIELEYGDYEGERTHWLTLYEDNNSHIRFSKGGLIAPNGKSSNLTPEQYRLVRTPEFKAWFGDWENDPKNASKVVDENGEPLVMFHGTQYGQFTEFNRLTIGKNYHGIPFGFYFTNIKTPDKLSGYSAQEYADKIGIGKKPYVFEVFLNIKNPIIQDVYSERPAQAIDWESDELRNKIRRQLFSSAKKIDGVIAESNWQSTKEVIAVALSPEQIKYADGSNTTFNATNPDIRFDKGGQTNSLVAPNGKLSNLTPEQYRLVRTPEFKAWFGDWEKLILTKLNDSGIDEVSLKRLEDGVSKVVDSNGEPLVVWHGTKKNFTIFGGDEKINQYLPEYRSLYNWKKNTNYFHKDKEYSETFGSKYGGQDKPYFLNVKNLIKTETTDDIEDIGYWKNIYDFYVEDFGADGVYDGYGQYATLVSPNQIKLADGTNTTFDGSNQDIRFDKGGLIAPNGKPSNLTPEQYKLVRTTAFKAWFGDWENDPENSSRVVDSNGEPLVVYHGSEKDYNIFDKEKTYDSRGYLRITGFYFTTNIKEAKQYGKPKPYFLNLKILSSTNSIESDYTLNKTNIKKILKNRQLKETQKGETYYEFTNKSLEEKINIISQKKDISHQLYDLWFEFFNYLDEWDDENKKWKERNKLSLFYDALVNSKVLDGVKYFFNKSNPYSGYFIAFQPNQIKLADGTNTTFDANNDDIRYAKGGRTISQTPSPEKDRVYGSLSNDKNSASNLSTAERIEFSKSTMKTIEEKVKAHNQTNPKKQITIESAKAVVRRGMGAYSKSHRPTISGGKPNSRVAWGLARLNAFIYKIINGKSKSGNYTQDDDLIKELGHTVSRFDKGGKTDIPTRFFGSQAGGVLIYCKSTERFLILLRSLHVLEPLTWGIISGKLDGSEDIEQTVRREAFEETGYDLPKLYQSYVFERPNFKFYNFLAVVNEEFIPDLNWENMGYAWVKLENMPNNLHFGLVELLKNGKIKSKLDQIIKRFKRGGRPKL